MRWFNSFQPRVPKRYKFALVFGLFGCDLPQRLPNKRPTMLFEIERAKPFSCLFYENISSSRVARRVIPLHLPTARRLFCFSLTRAQPPLPLFYKNKPPAPAPPSIVPRLPPRLP